MYESFSSFYREQRAIDLYKQLKTRPPGMEGDGSKAVSHLYSMTNFSELKPRKYCLEGK